MNKLKRWLRAAKRMFDKYFNAFYCLKDYLRYRKAVMMADDAHAKDGDRYYVMPSMDGKLLVMDRKNFRALKRKGYIQKNATMQSAIAECFYYTSRIGGAEVMPEHVRTMKYSEYKSWCKAMRILNHFTK